MTDGQNTLYNRIRRGLQELEGSKLKARLKANKNTEQGTGGIVLKESGNGGIKTVPRCKESKASQIRPTNERLREEAIQSRLEDYCVKKYIVSVQIKF